jgi:LAO/AO transport system kinase
MDIVRVFMQQLSETRDRILAGDVRSISKALSEVESGKGPSVTELLKQLYPHTGSSLIIGVTGSPGAGKSTLVEQLARIYSDQGLKVGIIAVDPTSPFSGGAILGDRVRMQSLATHPNVFIRSMATRGKMGGLSAAVGDALLVLDAAGYELLIVETVGVGQDEVDIVRTADVTIVVLVPGMGDDIQTIKAGIMEIGDLFVINKADHEGVERTRKEVEALLTIAPPKTGWTPPVLETVATLGRGISEVVAAIQDFQDTIIETGLKDAQVADFGRLRLLDMLRDRLYGEVLAGVSEKELAAYVERINARVIDPYTVVDELVAKQSGCSGVDTKNRGS